LINGLDRRIIHIMNISDKGDSQENLFRLLLNKRNESIWTVDRDLKLLFGNTRYHQFIADHFPGKEPPYPGLTEINDKNKATQWKRAYRRVLTGVECQFDYVTGLSSPGRFYKIKMTPIFHKEDVIGIASEGLDITGKVWEEEKISESQEKIRQMEKRQTISHLAGEMSRDFNNQLHAITGYVELLLNEKPLEGKQEEYHHHIMEAIDKSAQLVTRLRAYAQKDSHNPELLDANELLDELRTILRPVLDRKIKLEITKGAPYPQIMGDRSALLSSLINLIYNAREAMPDGGSISLSTQNIMINEKSHGKSLLGPGRYVKITVIDHGCGMDKYTCKEILEPPFYTTEHIKSMGIGLHSACRTIKKHMGNIEIRSTPGKGTKIHIFIPCIN
jgi:signal transduction histidine kinase